MRPAIEDGDWLLVDPTVGRWPRRGSIVVFREPDGDALAVKRVAGGPGDRVPFEGGFIELAEDEAWLESDASEADAVACGVRPADRFAPLRPRAARAARGTRVVPLRPGPPDGGTSEG